MPPRIFIYGSCVSRDVFSISPSGLELSSYIARSSFGSQFCGNVTNDKYSFQLASPFQARMVANDLNKLAKSQLLSSDYDLVLIDLIDERFDLCISPNNQIATLSSELLKTDFLQCNPSWKRITSGTIEHFEYWKNGWNNFIQYCRSIGILKRILINTVYWSEDFDDPSHQRLSKRSNAYLHQIYSYIKAYIPPENFIRYELSDLSANLNHTWGPAPFHFQDSFYHKTNERVRCIYRIINQNPDNKVLQLAASLIDSDYARWRSRVNQYTTLDAFLSCSSIGDGIHKIHDGLFSFELILEGFNASSSDFCLIVFGGAITSRKETSPPYFSGLGICKNTGIPAISFSDPALNLSKDLNLGWFCGHRGIDKYQRNLSIVIKKIVQIHALTPVFIGGSGGGFAALVQNLLFSETRHCLVWNPQTSISRYVSNFVSHYLSTAHLVDVGDAALSSIDPSTNEFLTEAYDCLSGMGFIHDLSHISKESFSNVVYLQNESDWHLREHAKLFFSLDHLIQVGPRSFVDESCISTTGVKGIPPLPKNIC